VCPRKELPLLKDRVLDIEAESVAALITDRHRAISADSAFQRHDNLSILKID
jgi:hypothetical protein